MPGDPYTRDDIVWMDANPKATLEEANAAGRCLGRSHHAYRVKQSDLAKKRWSLRDEAALTPQESPAQLLTRPQTIEQRRAYYATLHRAALQRIETMTRTDETEWYAPDDGLPVGFLCTGDWHQGAHGVLYDELEAHLAVLRDTPGLYGIGMGDMHEGVSVHSKARTALYSGIYNSADEQEEAVMLNLTTPPAHKWVVWLAGNHDEWMYKHAGLSRMSRLAREAGVESFGEGGGTVYANVGHQRYAIGVRHNHQGNSQLNTSNAQRRMVDGWLSWDTLHAAIVAHLHFNDLHIAPRHGKRCVYLRCGSFKVYDPYAKSHGFLPEMGTPLLILLPDEEKVLAFRGDDLSHGLDQLALLRERYAQ